MIARSRALLGMRRVVSRRRRRQEQRRELWRWRCEKVAQTWAWPRLGAYTWLGPEAPRAFTQLAAATALGRAQRATRPWPGPVRCDALHPLAV